MNSNGIEEPIRILWQSSTPVESLPAYVNAIGNHARRVLGDRVSVEVRGVASGSPDLQFRAIDFLNNSQVLSSALRASNEGFNAVALGCFVDPVLDELREVLDIPVLGMAETAMHLACMLGRRFAVLTRTPSFSPKFHRELVTRYGLNGRCSGHYAFDCPFEEVVAGLDGDADSPISKLERVAETAVAEGAEVLLIGCGVLNLVAMQSGINQLAGASVLDVSGALMKMTETMVTLQRACGTTVSRAGIYQRPTEEELANALKIYALDQP